MLFQSLRALCLAPRGPGSIWNHLGELVRSTGVSGRFACGFWTDLHFTDVVSSSRRSCMASPGVGKGLLCFRTINIIAY